MSAAKKRLAYLLLLCISLLALNNCGDVWLSSKTSPNSQPTNNVPPASPRPADDASKSNEIRFLENRVKGDPDDFVAYNKLAADYLQRLRETGSIDYLGLATRAAQASLKAIPAEQNPGGLTALAQAEYASHNFTAARDDALKLKELAPGKSYPYEILFDALLELGAYDEAEAAFAQMEKLGRGSIGTETRLARLSVLRGHVNDAQKHLSQALALAVSSSFPSRETAAWCRWQLGETFFSIGDYESAERSYRDSLTTFPDYYRALASMARVRIARNDLQGGMEFYEQAIKRLPDPTFVAALGDAYKLAGREREASAQYALVEKIGHLSAASGALYNRQLALFYADHDIEPEDAYANVTKEYEARKDVYGADALAWTALKAGKISEAQTAMKDALRLGTQDAKLFYHAGMIARVAGDKAQARDYLRRALSLNPQFDPLQSTIARQSLTELS